MRAGIDDGGFRWDGTPMRAGNGAQSLRSKSPMRTGGFYSGPEGPGYARNAMRSSSSGRHKASPLRQMVASASRGGPEPEFPSYPPYLTRAEERTSLRELPTESSGMRPRGSRSPLRGRSNGKRVTINE